MSQIFEITDKDGDTLEVFSDAGEDEECLAFTNSSEDRSAMSVHVDRSAATQLYAVLGQWLGKGSVPAGEATLTTDTALGSLSVRLGSLEASVSQDMDKISNLNGAMNRAHRRLNKLEESDLSSVRDLMELVHGHGHRLDKLYEWEADRALKRSALSIGQTPQETNVRLSGLQEAVEAMHLDLFGQRSAIHTTDQRERTATHEALVSLLTEIRDRLPVPAPMPKVCGWLNSQQTFACDHPAGHIGRHYNSGALLSWSGGTGFLPCHDEHPDNRSVRCARGSGHQGDHRSSLSREGSVEWPRQ